MNAVAPTSRHRVVDQVFGDNKAPLEQVLVADFADLQQEVADLLKRAGDLPVKVESDRDQTSIGKWIIDAKDLAHKVDKARTEEGRPILDAQRGINAFFKTVAAPILSTIDQHQKSADEYIRRKAAEARAKAQREAEEAERRAEEERRKADQLKRPDAIARAEGRAEAFDAAAEAAEERALASNADLTRMRAEGVTQSARTAWAWEFTDKGALYDTLGPLSPFFAEADVEKAINAMVRVQKGRTDLPGVKAFEKAVASFRR